MLVKNRCRVSILLQNTSYGTITFINSMFFHSVNFRLFIVCEEKEERVTGDFYKNEYNKDYKRITQGLWFPFVVLTCVLQFFCAEESDCTLCDRLVRPPFSDADKSYLQLGTTSLSLIISQREFALCKIFDESSILHQNF